MRRIVPCVTLGLALVGACAHEEAVPVVSTTTTTGAAVAQNASAITDITHQRCRREMSCNREGVGPFFENFEACVEQRGRETTNELSADACPNGITEGSLATCLNDIRNEACRNRIDTIDRVTSCRKICSGVSP